MASKWALAKAQKALGDAVDGDNMQYCNCKSCVRVVAQALDAAAEEVARTTMRVDHFYRYGVQPPDIPSHRENEIVKRVLDKLGR